MRFAKQEQHRFSQLPRKLSRVPEAALIDELERAVSPMRDGVEGRLGSAVACRPGEFAEIGGP
jgi:hypothetical protein